MPPDTLPATDTLVLALPAAGCDQRPLLAERIEVRGYLESGYEHSVFVPCLSSRAALPSTFHRPSFHEGHIWVVYAHTVHGRQRLRDARPERWNGYVRWAVIVGGTLEGPYTYGHFGIADHLLRITDIHRAETPTEGFCPP